MRTVTLASLLVVAAPVAAQTNGSTKSTREAYGTRLDNAAQPNNLNPLRLNNRLDTRLNSRLALRIERYRIGQTEDPTSAFAVKPEDRTRTAPFTRTLQQQQMIDDAP